MARTPYRGLHFRELLILFLSLFLLLGRHVLAEDFELAGEEDLLCPVKAIARDTTVIRPAAPLDPLAEAGFTGEPVSRSAIPRTEEAGAIVSQFEATVGPILAVVGKGGQAIVVLAKDLQGKGGIGTYKIRLKPGAIQHEAEFTNQLHDAYPEWARANHRDARQNPFLKMTLVAGTEAAKLELISKSVRARIPKLGPGNWRAALSTAEQMAQAVEFVNSKGIIHRDIKPDNFLQRDDGSVVLIDFGVAHESAHGAPTNYSGSPKYWHPDIIRKGEVSDRTDAYALGISIQEILLGTSLKEGSPYVTMRHLPKLPGVPDTVPQFRASPRTLDPRVPAAVSAVAWHEWGSARELRQFLVKARRASDKGRDDEFMRDVYLPQVFLPLLRRDALAAAQELLTSTEVNAAFHQGGFAMDAKQFLSLQQAIAQIQGKWPSTRSIHEARGEDEPLRPAI